MNDDVAFGDAVIGDINGNDTDGDGDVGHGNNFEDAFTLFQYGDLTTLALESPPASRRSPPPSFRRRQVRMDVGMPQGLRIPRRSPVLDLASQHVQPALSSSSLGESASAEQGQHPFVDFEREACRA